MMLTTALRRRNPTRYRPQVEGLEGRALLAIGQFSLVFSPTSAGANPPIPPVKGDFPDGSIDVAQFSFESTNPVTIGSASSGAGTGKVKFNPLVFSTHAGPQTAPLFMAAASGAHFNGAELFVRDTAARLIATYEFGLVFVTDQSLGGTSGANATETDQLTYGAIRISTMDPATGRPMSQSQWSQVTNTPTYTVPGIALSSVNPALSVATVQAEAASEIPTTITLKTSKTPKSSNVTLTAHVTSPSGAPVGNVTFYSGKIRLGQVAVGADGKASITVPASLTKKGTYAIFSGGLGSTFAPSTTVSGASQIKKMFLNDFGSPMTQGEWVLTSMWLQQGLTPAQMNSIYKGLAKT